MSSLKKIKEDYKALLEKGSFMLIDLEFQIKTKNQTKKLTKEEEDQKLALKGFFQGEYQNWFTESQILVKELIPQRLNEFSYLYIGDGKRKSITMYTYNIQDWLRGTRVGADRFTGEKPFDDIVVVYMNFQTQLGILKSLEARFVSTFFDIKTVLQADIFDSELDSAMELCNKGFYSGSGAICGVVLEKHFHQILSNRNVKISKKNLSLADLNELLKQNEIIQTHIWRQIQRLSDLRNICCHYKKNEDPTKDLVLELIDGTSKIIKSVF